MHHLIMLQDTCRPVLAQVGDAGVVAVARLCPQLAALGLHCCRRLTDAAVDAATAHLRHLTRLNVSGCVSLSPAAVQARRGTSMRHNCALWATLVNTDSATCLLKQGCASGCCLSVSVEREKSRFTCYHPIMMACTQHLDRERPCCCGRDGPASFRRRWWTPTQDCTRAACAATSLLAACCPSSAWTAPAARCLCSRAGDPRMTACGPSLLSTATRSGPLGMSDEPRAFVQECLASVAHI